VDAALPRRKTAAVAAPDASSSFRKLPATVAPGPPEPASPTPHDAPDRLKPPAA
jgi:hypothetical protein